ncbi:hypothetical protein [Bacillus suaedaesalsae]|uniref:Uncharacterized protein n=1 Tax=Bacillus suaedaesalsae TaxID=2810349 RepID=A0ABS2DFQ3_9BACI|nr:hypothetical protein [Bacillus suaedaesalsae]MBM6617277.1 hypothetical protein [Bacillus suaedaesalsae]
MTERKVQATLTISCDIVIDDTIKKNIEESYSRSLNDKEIANKLLYAFLNPKIDLFNEPDLVDGQWDMVCEFKGRFSDFSLDIEE